MTTNNRFFYPSIVPVGLILVGLAIIPTVVLAQGFAGGFAADPGAINTLNSGGGGVNAQFALDRTNAAVGGFPGAGGNSFDTFGAPPPGGPAPFAGFGVPAQAIQAQQPVVQQTTVSAIYGDRVICPVTGRLLEDAIEAPVLDQFINEYSDDGKTLGDYKADDGTFTNARFVRDFISPEAMYTKTLNLRVLSIMEQYNPLEFSNVISASTDPTSSLANTQELEEIRDAKLEAWAGEFLTSFKIDPKDAKEENSVFFQSFMPDPPLTPRVQIPPTFVPPRVVVEASGLAGPQAGPTGEAIAGQPSFFQDTFGGFSSYGSNTTADNVIQVGNTK